MKFTLALLLVALLWDISARGQEPASNNAPPSDSAPPSKTGPAGMQARGEEVVVDFVVRDKKGRAITDLSEKDFTAFDNGQPRAIRSFRLVQGADALNAAGARSRLDPLRQVRLVSLIFDRMDQDQRRLARQGALDLLKEEFAQNVYMAVFSLDLKLNALQAFTNNRDQLRKAIERATDGAYTQFGADSAQVRQQLEQFTGPNQAGKQDLEERVSQIGGGGDPNLAADHAMAELLLNMLSLDERSDSTQSGRSSIFGLLAAVRGQTEFPGRKTILYFSAGFVIPQGMEQPFRNVISSANRANVSFYPIDAQGLQTTSLNQRATAQLAAGASASSGAMEAGNPLALTESGGVSKQAALSTDTTLLSGRYNTQDTLAILASETGGFLVANTNDFRGPLHRISEEVQTYYELTYLPEIEKYDGSFRKIGIATNRADLRVQSRAGYFALPHAAASGGGILDAYEVPLLGALGTQPLIHTFPFESGGYYFRGEGREQTMAFVVDLPLTQVTVVKDESTGSYDGGLSYLALIKNEAGDVVKKLHGDVPLQLRSDQLGSYQTSRFTDAEYFDVPPGRYTVEAAVLDRDSNKVSARKTVVLVPKPTSSLSISSVALIRSWRAKEPDAGADDPFVLGDRVMTPTLTPIITKSSSNSLPFYFEIYPDAAKTETPEVTVEFTRDGKVRRIGTAPVSAPDALGRIRYVVTAPIEPLEPGNYEVRFTVTQANEVARESLALVLEP